MFSEKYYVFEVNKEKSFSKAAKNLFISQPALSLMVKKAEGKIGTPIFDRSTNPITLTEAGQYYIEQAEKIINIEQEAASRFSILNDNAVGKLKLGSSAYFITYLLTDAVRDFRSYHPNVDVQWMESNNVNLLNALDSNAIDMYVEVDTINDPALTRIAIGEESLLLAVPASYEINDKLVEYRLTAADVANHKHLRDDFPAVKISQFRDYPFILLKKGNDSYTRVMEMCANDGFTPSNVPIFADQVMTSFYLSSESHGISLIRDSILFKKQDVSNLYFYKPDDPLNRRSIYLYYLSKKPLTESSIEFIEFLKNYTS